MPEERNESEVEPASSPEQIHEMLSLTQPRRLPLVITVFILTMLLVIWAFAGKIPVEVSGRAVALTAEGVSGIEAQAEGKIERLFIEEGEVIRPGSLIAVIDNPLRTALLQKIESLHFQTRRLEKELETLRARLETRKGLHKEGLVAKTVVEDAEITISQKEIQLADIQAQLASALSELEKTASGAGMDFLRKPGKDLFHKYSLTAEELDAALSRITSPKGGKVLEVLVNEGDLVQAGDPVAWIESAPESKADLRFFSCIPVQQQNRIQKGMVVRVEPTIVNPQEFGAILGEVESISQYVASDEELLNTLQNPRLVKFLTENAPAVTQLSVKPRLDPVTPSGLKWTSGEGPPFEIPTGTLCNVRIEVESQPPISFLFPIWKLKPQ